MVADDPRRARPGAKEARTRVQILERRGSRALVELRPETGRTHQIRVQLAAIGAPIDGDVLYGGAPASRLMLHARRLALRHPTSGAPLVAEAPEPRALRDHLVGALERLPPDVAGVVARLRDAAALRHPIAASGETDAFRLCNGAGDALPGVTVDLYGQHLVVSLAGELDEEAGERALDAAHALGARGVYVKRRPRHASVVVDTRRDEVAPPLPVRGEAAPDPLVVRENELTFEVRLGDGLSTGLFLDTRAHRARVRAMAEGTRFLNLFAYTGSFTVAAAAGGAAATTTVDVSRTVLAWGERNLALNRLAGPAHGFAEADVLGWLDAQARLGGRWDLVVLDPPSFATTKSSRFSVESDYRDLVARVMRVTSPGGAIVCCTNHRGVVMAKLRRWIHEAARAAGCHVARLRDLPAPADFPPVPGMEPHLKVALVTLGEPSSAPAGGDREPAGARPGHPRGGPAGRMRRR
jgi:23S rRNA (cytosine1962-C5)-methyltransferase